MRATPDTVIVQRPNLGWVWFRRISLILVVLLSAERMAGQSVVLREYSVKAAFLYNLVKYTDWPSRAFPEPDAPIVIGLLGSDPFGTVLDRIVEGRIINGHPILVRRATGVAELKGAHVVFVGASESSRAAEQCAALESFRALTVGDTEQTAAFAAVKFGLEADRVVFTVDLTRTSRVGVNISSKVLHLAKAVLGRDGAPGR